MFKNNSVILWRHADAADAAPGESDQARALTDKGQREAKQMAAWLNQRLPPETVVLVSPALRAQQTAKALKRAFITSAALDTSTDCAAVLKAVGAASTEGVVLIVGHQPTLGEVASLLLTGTVGALSVKKGAAWCLGIKRERKSRAVLQAVMSPEIL